MYRNEDSYVLKLQLALSIDPVRATTWIINAYIVRPDPTNDMMFNDVLCVHPADHEGDQGDHG